MRIEIYVVETLKPSQKSLETLKEALIGLFGGLTELPFKGYWRDEKGKICADSGKIWLIYTDALNLNPNEKFASLLDSIKNVTGQQSQAWALNSEMHFL